jgi:hypothetical protein
MGLKLDARLSNINPLSDDPNTQPSLTQVFPLAILSLTSAIFPNAYSALAIPHLLHPPFLTQSAKSSSHSRSITTAVLVPSSSVTLHVVL